MRLHRMAMPSTHNLSAAATEAGGIAGIARAGAALRTLADRVRRCPGPRRMAWLVVLAIALVTGLGPGAQPARAAVVYGSFVGVISQASDTQGLFGVSPQALLGTRITGTFSYDTKLLPPPVTVVSPVSYSWYGASETSPTIAMTETINGVTVYFGGAYFEDVFTTHSMPPIIGKGDGEVPSFQEWGLESCNISGFLYACSTISVGAADNSVHIVGNPANPAVSFSLNNITPGYAVGGGSAPTGPCPGTLCPTWAFNVTSVVAEVPEPDVLWLFMGGVALVLRLVSRRPASVA